jgi:hypothetical protein
VLTLGAPGSPVSLLPTGVGEARVLPVIRSDTVDFGAFSPDGDKVAFVENEANGTARVFVQAADGKNPSQTTLFRGKAPWSGVIFDADSKGVVTAVSNDGLVVLPIGGGAAKPIRGTLPGDIPIMVGAASTLYLQRVDDLPGRIYAVDMIAGTRRVLIETPAADPAGVFAYGPAAISSDGRTWATSVHRQLSRLMIVER